MRSCLPWALVPCGEFFLCLCVIPPASMIRRVLVILGRSVPSSVPHITDVKQLLVELMYPNIYLLRLSGPSSYKEPCFVPPPSGDSCLGPPCTYNTHHSRDFTVLKQPMCSLLASPNRGIQSLILESRDSICFFGIPHTHQHLVGI